MKKLVRNNIGELVTFVFTILFLLILFKFIGILNHSIIVSDLRTQVYPLISQLKNKFLTSNLSLFDFNIGMGDNMVGIIYYYLMSPFNVLALFVDKMDTFFLIIIILKSAFSSFFCYKYLKYQFKTEKKVYFFIFSLMYAVSSYFLSYNMVVEFLDIYMIFPLLLLGIDKIIKEKKHYLYIISLSLIILFNYYFAYMVCIFCFLYYNYRILVLNISFRDILKKNVTFIILSALVCLSMSFVLLPIATEIGSYSHENSILFGGEHIRFLFNFHSFVDYYLIGNMKNIGIINIKDFYIYTSIISFPLIYFYFINDKFTKREKICTSFILLLLLISIGCNYVNYAWHGFIPPCGFNGRFTFMFILFLIYICAKSMYNLQKFETKHYVIVFSIIYFTVFIMSIVYFPRIIDIEIFINFLLAYFFVIAISLLSKRNVFNIKQYLFGFIFLVSILALVSYIFKFNYLSILFRLGLLIVCIFLLNFINKSHNIRLKHYFIFLLVFLIPISLYAFYKNVMLIEKETYFKLLLLFLFLIILKYIPQKRKLNILIVMLLILELFNNGYGYLFRFYYKTKLDNSYEQVIKYIKDNEDSLYYRIEDNYTDSPINYSILYDYSGIDYFMSTIKKDVVNFFDDMDFKNYDKSDNSINYDGSYNLLSSLLNVKYYIETKNHKNNFYTKLDTINDYDIYKNDDSLEVGYMVNKKLRNLKHCNNGLEYINNIYKTMTDNKNDVLEKVVLSKTNEKLYTFNNSQNKDFYILIKLKDKVKNPKLKVYLNNNLLDVDNHYYLYKINNIYELNDLINIGIKANRKNMKKIEGVYIYYYNEQVYKDNINILKSNQLNITDIHKNTMKGSINTSRDNLLFLSIHYDKNLDVYVDGEKAEKQKLLNTFIGINLKKGKHKIVIKYKPKIIYISLIPSFIGLILLIIYLKKIRNCEQK